MDETIEYTLDFGPLYENAMGDYQTEELIPFTDPGEGFGEPIIFTSCQEAISRWEQAMGDSLDSVVTDLPWCRRRLGLVPKDGRESTLYKVIVTSDEACC